MRRTLLASVLVFGALLAGVALGQELQVEYMGELIDDRSRPLGGVFQLTFKLYSEDDSASPLWEEQHYLAVVDGEYAVNLGSEQPLDPSLAEQELQVAVEFMGQELLREPLVLRPVAVEVVEEPPSFAELFIPSAGNFTEVTFAQLADQALVAVNAEHAQDCDTLGGRSLEDIDRSDDVLERLADHQTDPSAHESSGRSRGRVGTGTTVLQRVGGEGGARYTVMCPSGYAIVGARGGAANLVDSIEFVCAPIE